MRIYQLMTAKQFLEDASKDLTIEQLLMMYAEDVSKKFAAECVNEALGNEMEVSNGLHIAIDKRYKSIIWD